MRSKTAIILGATGLTGRYLLDLLVAGDDYEKVKVFTRRPTGKKHPKIEEIICDLLHLEQNANSFTADEVFCCIGTTKAKTPDKTLYHAIDFGIPVSAAQLAAQQKIPTFSVISAIGAHADSTLFHSRTKGKMEQRVLACDIPNILIYRPSLIYGQRPEHRWFETIGTYMVKALQIFMVGKLKKYQAISGQDLAEALFLGVKNTGHQIIFRDEFLSLKKQ
ncbi:MAG: nucleoside-diphosphate sugar epimerase [Flavobacteriales bacterium]|nr:MAG: nucleoside-diphosphate sugar epimerase [Flavobacteriales bacterium]